MVSKKYKYDRMPHKKCTVVVLVSELTAPKVEVTTSKSDNVTAPEASPNNNADEDLEESFEIPFDVFEINSRALAGRENEPHQQNQRENTKQPQSHTFSKAAEEQSASCPSCVCQCPSADDIVESSTLTNDVQNVTMYYDNNVGDLAPHVDEGDDADVDDASLLEDERELFHRQQKRLDILLGLIEEDEEGEAQNDIEFEEKGNCSWITH